MSEWLMTVPVLNSAHLTMCTTKNMVYGKFEDLPVAPYDAGMFVWVGHEQVPEGFPADLQDLVRWAKRYHYEWVRLDAIGVARDDLPTYPNTWS